MTMESRTTLSSETIAQLQDLIQLNIDSQKGFIEASEHLEEMSLRGLFEALAAERGQQAQELQAVVAANAEHPQDTGSVSAAMHRVWIDLRSAMGGGATAMLQEAERGEDTIKEKYEEVLSTASPAIRDIIVRQASAVKMAHDRIRDMRDAREAMG
jgi:uncharacterized protein (TIGR02284 family)